MNPNLPSMCGRGNNGVTDGWEWVNTKAVLPNEIQITGSMAISSSYMDIAESCSKLALFNFINPEESRISYWLRGIGNTECFTMMAEYGAINLYGASLNLALRPLICIT